MRSVRCSLGLGIDHWTVEPRRTRVTIWAVRKSDWPTVLAGLVSGLGGQGLRLRLRSPSMRRQRDVPLDASLSAAKLPQPTSVSVFRPIRDRSTGLASDDAAVSRIQIWDESPRRTLRTAEKSGVVHEVPDDGKVETILIRRWDGVALPKPIALAEPDASEIDFEVDAVYLWVDDSDPQWRARREEVRQRLGLGSSQDPVAAHRFRDRGELRASFRSLEMYAPWIRRIFLVTDQQCPKWLDQAAPPLGSRSSITGTSQTLRLCRHTTRMLLVPSCTGFLDWLRGTF